MQAHSLWQKSFKTILEERLSEDRASTERTISSEDNSPAHMAFLIGKMGKFEFQVSRVSTRNPYPKAKPAVRPNHMFNHSQWESFLFLTKWAGSVAENFNTHELKQAFRRAALRLHPDQGGDPHLFLCLRSHFENLEVLLVKASENGHTK